MSDPELIRDFARRGFEDLVRVGSGGFAVVYRARQPEYGRTVALKVLHGGHLDGTALERFARERRALGLLSNHPNIVTVYSGGVTDQGSMYLVMEYVPSGSLADRVSRRGAMPWPESIHIGVKLCGALETAHRQGVLHRDLKPENVLLSDFGEPLLGDFGIARLTGALVTSSNAQNVTIAHAPPEVFSGLQPSPRSDVYSLASTIMTLILGAPPFVRPSDESILPLYSRIAHDPPPDLRVLGVPDRICAVLEQNMAKSPDTRSGSALAFGEELQKAQRHCQLTPTAMPLGPGVGGDEHGWRDPTTTSGAFVTPPPAPVAASPEAEALSAPAAAVIVARAAMGQPAPLPGAVGVGDPVVEVGPPARPSVRPMPPAAPPSRTSATPRRWWLAIPAVAILAAAAIGVLALLRDGVTPIPVPAGGLAAGDDEVWLVAGDGASRSLVRVAAGSGVRLGEPQRNFPLRDLRVVGADGVGETAQVWAGNDIAYQIDEDLVSRTSLRTPGIQGQLDLLDVAGGHLWALHRIGDAVRLSVFSIVDGSDVSGATVASEPTEVAVGLDAEPGVGWVVTGRPEVVRIDVTGRSQVYGIDRAALDVAVVGGTVWVATDEGSVLRFVPPADQGVEEPAAVPVDATSVVVAEGQRLDELVTDGVDVWVSGPGAGVWRLPADLLGPAEKLELPDAGPKVLALGPGALWVADPDRGELHRIDSDTEIIQRIDIAPLLNAAG